MGEVPVVPPLAAVGLVRVAVRAGAVTANVAEVNVLYPLPSTG